MKLSKIAAPLAALVASWLCGCAPGLGPASRERASAASVSAEPSKRSPSAIERASPLAPSPFRLVGELPLDLHVLEDGRVVGERARKPTAKELETSPGSVDFARDFFLLRGRRFERINHQIGVLSFPQIHCLVGTSDGAIDALVVLYGEQLLFGVDNLLGPDRGRKAPLFDYYQRLAGCGGSR